MRGHGKVMRLLEDILSNDDTAAIEEVLASNNPRFDLLVETAGLDRKSDFTFSDLRRLNFCGADLRGFDFTGSDLRQCVRNGYTLIDDTTILDGAQVDWIEIEALPIVVKMQEVEAASGSEKRQQLLNELTTEFGRTDHVVTYMVSAASKSKTLDEFLDFALFLPQSLSEGQSGRLRVAAQKLLRKKLALSKSRTRRENTAILAMDDISEKLRLSSGSLAERIYEHLADIVTSKHQTIILSGMATIEPKDMEEAFEQIGR